MRKWRLPRSEISWQKIRAKEERVTLELDRIEEDMLKKAAANQTELKRLNKEIGCSRKEEDRTFDRMEALINGVPPRKNRVAAKYFNLSEELGVGLGFQKIEYLNQWPL